MYCRSVTIIVTSATNKDTWLASSNHRTSAMGSFQNNDILGVAITVMWIRISLIRIQILDRPREKKEKIPKKHKKNTMLQNNDLLLKFLFMCVKPRCNFYFKKHDILVIFVSCYMSFTMIILADLLLPGSRSEGQNHTDPTKSWSSSI